MVLIYLQHTYFVSKCTFCSRFLCSALKKSHRPGMALRCITNDRKFIFLCTAPLIFLQKNPSCSQMYRNKSYFEISWFATTSKNLKSLLNLQSFPLDPDTVCSASKLQRPPRMELSYTHTLMPMEDPKSVINQSCYLQPRDVSDLLCVAASRQRKEIQDAASHVEPGIQQHFLSLSILLVSWIM